MKIHSYHFDDFLQIKKQAAKTLKQEHKQEIEDLTSKFNSQVENEVEKHSKEKSRMEKELKSMRKRAEKAELELSKAESLKSSAASNGASSEAFFQDILVNLKEFMGDQLQCSICNEIYVFPTSLNCGHSFCEDCIGKKIYPFHFDDIFSPKILILFYRGMAKEIHQHYLSNLSS